MKLGECNMADYDVQCYVSNQINLSEKTWFMPCALVACAF